MEVNNLIGEFVNQISEGKKLIKRISLMNFAPKLNVVFRPRDDCMGNFLGLNKNCMIKPIK